MPKSSVRLCTCSMIGGGACEIPFDDCSSAALILGGVRPALRTPERVTPTAKSSGTFRFGLPCLQLVTPILRLISPRALWVTSQHNKYGIWISDSRIWLLCVWEAAQPTTIASERVRSYGLQPITATFPFLLFCILHYLFISSSLLHECTHPLSPPCI